MNLKDWKEWLLMSAWILAVLGGFAALNVYANRSGHTTSKISGWPSLVERQAGKDTLVLFLHPRCACSRATIAELERALPHLKDKVDVIVNLYYPSKDGETFARGRLFESMVQLPGVQVRFDKDAAIAETFGARISGEAMYFSKNGDLRFHGGLTPARGHEGDNVGLDSVSQLADGERPNAFVSKVFGCQLKEDLRNEVALAQ